MRCRRIPASSGGGRLGGARAYYLAGVQQPPRLRSCRRRARPPCLHWPSWRARGRMDGAVGPAWRRRARAEARRRADRRRRRVWCRAWCGGAGARCRASSFRRDEQKREKLPPPHGRRRWGRHHQWRGRGTQTPPTPRPRSAQGASRLSFADDEGEDDAEEGPFALQSRRRPSVSVAWREKRRDKVSGWWLGASHA